MFLSAVIVWTNYPQSVIRACLDFEFLEEWILFVIASYCELKTD